MSDLYSQWYMRKYFETKDPAYLKAAGYPTVSTVLGYAYTPQKLPSITKEK